MGSRDEVLSGQLEAPIIVPHAQVLFLQGEDNEGLINLSLNDQNNNYLFILTYQNHLGKYFSY